MPPETSPPVSSGTSRPPGTPSSRTAPGRFWIPRSPAPGRLPGPALSSPVAPGYLLRVPRSRLSHLVTIAFLFLAAALEPAWAVAHAVVHLEEGHETGATDRQRHDLAGSTVSAPDQANAHGHPLLQSPVRPAVDFAQAIAALPARPTRVSGALSLIRGTAFVAVPARASPRLAHSPQPRAPPLP